MNENKNEFEIDIFRLLRALKRCWIIILAVTLIGAVGGLLYTQLFVTPVYQVEARAVLSFGSSEEGNRVNTNTLNYGTKYLSLFSEVLTSSEVLKPVVEELRAEGNNITYDQLASKIKVESVNETQMLKLTVKHTDKELAYKIADKVFARGQYVIDITLTEGEFYVTDLPEYSNNGNPVSPNLMKNTIIYGVVALILAVGVIVVCELFNNKIRSEKDLESVLGVPVIGKIPSADSKAGKKYGYGE